MIDPAMNEHEMCYYVQGYRLPKQFIHVGWEDIHAARVSARTVSHMVPLGAANGVGAWGVPYKDEVPMHMEVDKLIASMFPGINGIQRASAWKGETYKPFDGIHLGDAAEGGQVGSDDAAEFYAMGVEPFDQFGVHQKLADALDLIDYYTEWYDAGTLFAYRR